MLLIIILTLNLLLSFTKVPMTAQVEAATVKNSGEYRAFWLSYYDFNSYRKAASGGSDASFRLWFTKVVKNGKKLGMKTVIVQVRPFGDALYPSRYFPWSEVISGKQGKNPGYDPLKIMTEVAHENGLRIEAWVNPYRVTSSSVNYRLLSPNNRARIWHGNRKTARNVLAYRGQLYYNPSSPAVRKLIVTGVKEIVNNYDVDGIHMDDYFYPSFSPGNVRTAFDAKEYKKSAAGKRGQSISRYRRNQVNILVRQIHRAVKSVDRRLTFGISPAGDPDELSSNYAHYVDYRTWLASSSYIDYICPQIYWGFQHSYCQFDKITRKWKRAARSSSVKLYLGIAVYKSGHYTGSNGRERREWKKDTSVLQKQIAYGRKKKVKGFAFFDYSDLVSSISRKAVLKMAKEIKKKK